MPGERHLLETFRPALGVLPSWASFIQTSAQCAPILHIASEGVRPVSAGPEAD
jgi:hypothetical protein